MLSYTLEKKPGCTLHESLYRQIRNDIESGAIAPGQLLPSKRELSRALGVSIATIEGAYLQLAAEGYIISRPRRGFFACSLPANAKAIADLRCRPKTPECAGTASSGAPSAELPVRLDLTGATRTRRFFPAKEWGRLLRDVLADGQERPAGRLPACGSESLRGSIAKHIRLSRGIEAALEQIVIGAGAQQLYQMCALMFGDSAFAVEDPGYPSIAQTYASLGRSVVRVPVDDAGMSMEALRLTEAAIAHVSPSHHFPTGAVMPAARRFELLAWAYERPDRYIVEDDYDCEFRLAGKPIPALSGVDVEGRAIYMNTFTKSMAGALRLAYMVLPRTLLPRFEDACGHLICAASPIEQEAMARFIDAGCFDKQVNRTCKRYRDCRGILAEGIGDACKDAAARISRDAAGTFFLVEFAERIDEASFLEGLAQKGVAAAFVPSVCGWDGAPELPQSSKLVVDYSALVSEKAAEAAIILAEAIEESRMQRCRLCS